MSTDNIRSRSLSLLISCLLRCPISKAEITMLKIHLINFDEFLKESTSISSQSALRLRGFIIFKDEFLKESDIEWLEVF